MRNTLKTECGATLFLLGLWWCAPHPLSSVRATRDLLQSRGFPVHYREFAKAGHNYGAVAKEVNADAWDFFQRIRLR